MVPSACTRFLGFGGFDLGRGNGGGLGFEGAKPLERVEIPKAGGEECLSASCIV
jgi:hypothetical protein